MTKKKQTKPIKESKLTSRNDLHIQKIKNSALNKMMVEIKYKDKKGNISSRQVEPYKISGNDLWAYDPEKNSVRRFKIKGLKSVKPTKNIFEPRWDIEMDKVAFYKEKIEKVAFLGFQRGQVYTAAEEAAKNIKRAKQEEYGHFARNYESMRDIKNFVKNKKTSVHPEFEGRENNPIIQKLKNKFGYNLSESPKANHRRAVKENHPDSSGKNGESFKEYNNLYNEALNKGIIKRSFLLEHMIEKFASDLTSSQRNDLSSKVFGLPKERKFPMPDKQHTLLAWRSVNRAKGLSSGQITELKQNIKSRAKTFGINTNNWN